MKKSRFTALINNDRDREILEYGLIIGSCISDMQKAGEISFTEAWACDNEMAKWSEKIIDNWVNGWCSEAYFSDFVVNALVKSQKAITSAESLKEIKLKFGGSIFIEDWDYAEEPAKVNQAGDFYIRVCE